MTDDIAALIEETEHLLAILECRATEETSYDYIQPKIERAKTALSRLTTSPLPDEIAGLVKRADVKLMNTEVDDWHPIVEDMVDALRALAQENERLKAEGQEELRNNAEGYRKRIRELEAERDKYRTKYYELKGIE